MLARLLLLLRLRSLASSGLLLLRLLRLWDVTVEGIDLAPLHRRRGRTHVRHLREFFGQIGHRLSGSSIVGDLIKRRNIREGKREGGVA